LIKDTDFYAYYSNNIAKLKTRVEKVSAFAMKKYHFTIDKININLLN